MKLDVADDQRWRLRDQRARQRARVGVFEADDARIVAQRCVQLAAGRHRRRKRARAPRASSTCVKPPVEAPTSRQTRPAGSTPNASSACASFTPPRDTQGCGGVTSSAASSAIRSDGFRHQHAVGAHAAGFDRRARLGAALGKAARHKQKIGANAGHVLVLARRVRGGKTFRLQGQRPRASLAPADDVGETRMSQVSRRALDGQCGRADQRSRRVPQRCADADASAQRRAGRSRRDRRRRAHPRRRDHRAGSARSGDRARASASIRSSISSPRRSTSTAARAPRQPLSGPVRGRADADQGPDADGRPADQVRQPRLRQLRRRRAAALHAMRCSRRAWCRSANRRRRSSG